MFAIGMDHTKIVSVDGVPIPFVVEIDQQAGRVKGVCVDDAIAPRTTNAAQASKPSDADRLSGVLPEMRASHGGIIHTVYFGSVTVGPCEDPQSAFKRGRSHLRQFDEWPSAEDG